MTPDELKKEAERFVNDYYENPFHEPLYKLALESFRAVHDACMKEAGKFAGDSAKEMYIEGFNDGVEKAAGIVRNQDRVKAENMMALQNNAVREILALKLSSEAGGNE